MNQILEDWPLFKQRFGYSLVSNIDIFDWLCLCIKYPNFILYICNILKVELDFKKIYPEKENLLVQNWEGFCGAILPLMQERIKDFSSIEILKRFKSENFGFGNLFLLLKILVFNDI